MLSLLFLKAKREFPKKFIQMFYGVNGGEWCSEHEETSSFQFWSCTEIIENTEANGVNEFSPGLILIGSDGGEAFTFDARNESNPEI